jgi:hypothetical protein
MRTEPEHPLPFNSFLKARHSSVRPTQSIEAGLARKEYEHNRFRQGLKRTSVNGPHDTFIDKRTNEAVQFFQTNASQTFRKNSPSDDGMQGLYHHRVMKDPFKK